MGSRLPGDLHWQQEDEGAQRRLVKSAKFQLSLVFCHMIIKNSGDDMVFVDSDRKWQVGNFTNDLNFGFEL